MYKLYLEAAAEQNSWSCARQKIILSRGAGCDQSWVWVWPIAALPCVQRALIYDMQRKAAEENCIFGKAQQVLPALFPGEEQLVPAALCSSLQHHQIPLQQGGHFSLGSTAGLCCITLSRDGRITTRWILKPLWVQNIHKSMANSDTCLLKFQIEAEHDMTSSVTLIDG